MIYETNSNMSRQEFIQNYIDQNKTKIKVGEISDELYYHRMVLFAMICNTYKQKAWKSLKHSDGTMFDNYFIVGITTPRGNYTYHYNEQYLDYFEVKELTHAPEWDRHKPSDIERLFTLL